MDQVFVLTMDYNNTETYSDGDEVAAFATRDGAVARVRATARRLGLQSDRDGDPVDGKSGLAFDPPTTESGEYFVHYQGFLHWKITTTAIES